MSSLVTLGEMQRHVAATLRQHGFEAAQLEARLLIGLATGLDRMAMIAGPDRVLSGDEQVALAGFLARRLAHEPIARLGGEQEFYGRIFHLNSHCLIPRPDTETLIDVVLPFMRAMKRPQVLDIGTGPGTILLTLLAECPDATGIGVDLSASALHMAHENAARLALCGRASFVCGQWCAAFCGRFDVIVANPPYIPVADILGLQAEVRLFDPQLALDGGHDGLERYRVFLPDIHRLLADNGVAALEFGVGQANDIAALSAKHGFTCRIINDLGGLARVALLQK